MSPHKRLHVIRHTITFPVDMYREIQRRAHLTDSSVNRQVVVMLRRVVEFPEPEEVFPSLKEKSNA